MNNRTYRCSCCDEIKPINDEVEVKFYKRLAKKTFKTVKKCANGMKRYGAKSVQEFWEKVGYPT